MSKRIEMNELVYIRYLDHVLFRNTNPSINHPNIRECCGWVIKEDNEAVWVLFDRSAKPLPNEKNPATESGLIVLKSLILEMKKVELATQ